MYTTVLFDFDGTLVDTKDGIMRCVAMALEELHYPVPEKEELLTYIGPPLIDQFMLKQHMTLEQSGEAVSIFRKHYNTTGKEECRPFPGVEEMLKALKAKGKTLVIASSKPEPLLHSISDRFGLEKYFDSICGAIPEIGRNQKTQVIEEALRQLSVTTREEKEKLLMVGDRLHDIIGAKNTGLKCAGMTFGYGGREELKTCGADYLLDSWEELITLVEAQ